MQSIAYIPGSNGAGNASQMTVQNVRSPGASDILVNTVTGVPTKFYGSMGEPHTFTDPVTGETITLISEATAVDFAGHVDSGKLVIDAIAPGYVDTRGSLVGDIVVIRPVTEWANNLFNILSQAHNDDGSIKDSAIIYDPNVSDHVVSGGIWSLSAGLNGAMTALVGYQAGHLNSLAAVASRLFTASRDTYIDVLRNTTTNAFTLVYTEVANNVASPALAADSFRLAKVVTNASVITSVVQIGRDSLKNTIYPNGAIGGGDMNTSELLGNVLFQPSTVGHNVGSQGTNYNLGPGTGATVTFTVEKACMALVTVNVAMRSTSDYEFRPQIFLDGVFNRNFGYPSANSNGGRSIQRGGTAPVILTAGTHTISAGVFVSSATNPSCDADGVNVCVLVLGKVIG